MNDGLWVDSDGLESAGRSSYTAAGAAEEAHRAVSRVNATPASYGGATEFVGALNGARDVHARGAEAASEGREVMGDGDHGAAGFSHDLDGQSSAIIRGANAPDQGVADAI
ncbi:hypothetical protein [Streptomyces otsuchiensis]|uniref:hypothetical protein n=1 Tax=Streptomyces otsuchiensis TaxID=2681388 RepID=UPI001300263E|nr:hypothetical protein [Streptomyces otsuchiensis]